MNYDMITILGPTASGKTSLATHLAAVLGNVEIVSADSRQVYKGMDIGTGKDLSEYQIDGKAIPYHLIDIVEAGEKYNLYQYQTACYKAIGDIRSRGKIPLMCGGTGLYLESVLRAYRMAEVPPNPALREELNGKSLDQLTEILQTYKQLHNITDVDTPQRAIRAIEIQKYYADHPHELHEGPQLKSLNIGVDISRELRRERITQRLHERLKNGMVEEVASLLKRVPAENLIYYGLEYKFVTLYCIGELSYDEMVSRLEIAIHQFAKRQMTWFRGMERRGIHINWLRAEWSMDQKLDFCIKALKD